MVLEIKKRDNIPFGDLLLSTSEIHIESKKWKTPLNYIFSKLFPRGLLHEELRNASVDDLPTILNRSREQQHHQILSQCLTQYLTEKLNQNPAFAQELGRSHTSKLVCDVFSQNLYGKTLEQVRQSRLCRRVEEREQDPIYYMYLASKALKEILVENNLQEFLDQKFKRMSDLLRALEQSTNRERVIRKAPDRETILKIHKRLEVDYTTNPSTLIRLIRRKYIRRVRELALIKIKTIVLEEFIKSISAFHPAKPEWRDAVIEREKQTIDLKKNIELTTRAHLLYTQRKLPASVLTAIDERVRRVYLPTLEEIEHYETDVFLLHPGSETKNQAENTKVETLIITSKSLLHPFSVDHLTIDDVVYSTCIHYVVAQTIIHEDHSKNVGEVAKKLVKYETKQLLPLLEKWRRKHRQEIFNKIVDQTLYIFFKDVKHQHLLLCTGQEALVLTCFLIPDLSRKMMKIRESLTPKIYRVSNLEQVKDIYKVQEWCVQIEEMVKKIHMMMRLWLRDKGSEKVLGIDEIIRHFFNANHDTVDSLTTSHLKSLAKFNNDLSIVDFILKKQYTMSNQWVKPPRFQSFTACLRDSMTLFALCQIMLVFDRIVDVPVTLNDVDVGHAKSILTHHVRSDEQEYISDMMNVDSEDENDLYDDDDDDPNPDDYDHLEFEGNDVIFKYLQANAFNGLSDYVETSLFECLKTIDIAPNRNHINFFAGIML